ncbi:class I SAM-dependent methyltransferase [Kandleria vitulina]|jgi:ubiquinone/menaquinone biosynthesis C-methylase UbiE|uniref:class I SAM-dependent methyltransferase n=1 Tax=Kandleria vitulina TaxID=1630 RepID=UPI00055DC3D0|nr:class I SAM-dependent methyltransferase [Kandleria vitulina]SEJ33639.1 Ubiquinone/menaquinone biosynthesis C-methylase UbiE [Kandleria vitulina]
MVSNPARPQGEEGKKMLERMNRSHAPLREWGLSFYDWKDHLHILDIGCGGGATIKDMLSLSEGSVINGVDYMEASVKLASIYNEEELGKRVFIKQGDVANLPYENDSFDLVTAVETIYFWKDIKDNFKEVKRVLKEGGTFLVLCEGSDPDENNWPKIDGLVKIYTPEEVAGILKENHFKNIRFHRGEGQYIAVLGEK